MPFLSCHCGLSGLIGRGHQPWSLNSFPLSVCPVAVEEGLPSECCCSPLRHSSLWLSKTFSLPSRFFTSSVWKCPSTVIVFSFVCIALWSPRRSHNSCLSPLVSVACFLAVHRSHPHTVFLGPHNSVASCSLCSLTLPFLKLSWATAAFPRGCSTPCPWEVVSTLWAHWFLLSASKRGCCDDTKPPASSSSSSLCLWPSVLVSLAIRCFWSIFV